MANVKVLLEGYWKKVSETEDRASSTVTLVRDKEVNLIVDPGTGDKEYLEKSLQENSLTFDDIHYIVLTHKHLDHCRNMSLFPKAKIVDNWGIVDGDREIADKKISGDVELIDTPGHSEDSQSLLVKTEEGLVGVVGDLFINSDLEFKDPFATDFKKLEQSRKLVLEKVDFIITGHAGMVKVKK